MRRFIWRHRLKIAIVLTLLFILLPKDYGNPSPVAPGSYLNGFKDIPGDLDDLNDVNAPSPSDDDSLTWDSGTSKWIPEAVVGGGGGNVTVAFRTIQVDGTDAVADTTTDTLIIDDGIGIDVDGTNPDTITIKVETDGIDDTLIDWGNGTNQVNARDIELDYIGSPDNKTLYDYFNVDASSGILTGGAITSNGDGTASIASVQGMIRTENSETAQMVFFTAPANTTLSLTDDNTNYIYVDYNSGSPRIKATTSQAILFDVTKPVFAGIFRGGNTLHTLNTVSQYSDYVHRNNLRNYEIDGVIRTSGQVTTDNGNLTFAVTAGVMYAGIDRISSSSLDTGNGDTIPFYWTADSSNWTTVNLQQINNTQYNNIASGLSTLTANRYGIAWIYVDFDGADFHGLYGRGDHTLIQAEDAQPPSVVPNVIGQFANLVAKIIIQKSGTTMIIFTPFGTQFTGAFVQNHNDLGMLQGGTSDQYYHLTSSEYTELNGWLDDVSLGSSGAWAIPTGQAFTLGSTQWDNGSDAIDGEVIADNTIDNDSIDWADMSHLSTDGIVVDFALTADADAGDFDILSIDKLEGFDAQIYIDFGTDGQLDIEGDIINILGPTDFGSNAADFDSATVTLSTVAGAINAGNATSLALPASDNPTTDANAEIAVDLNNNALELFTNADSRLIPTSHIVRVSVAQPETIQDDTDAIPLLWVGNNTAPFGIKIVTVGITTAGSTSYSVGFEEWVSSQSGSGSTIETVATSTSYEAFVSGGDIDDSDIAAGSWVYADLPTTDIDLVTFIIEYWIKPGN